VPYVTLGESRHPFRIDANTARDHENGFVLGDKIFPGPVHRHQTTMAIKRSMAKIDFRDKHVIDVGCADGVFCFHAESRGAARVLGTTLSASNFSKNLKAAKESSVQFLQHGIYGVEQFVTDRFDVVFFLRWLQMTRHPLLLIRTLSRLMKEGGELVLNTDYLDCYPGVPMMYTPVGSEAPVNSHACTYFNKDGLLNALTSYGFHDFVIHAELKQAVDMTRDFVRIPFPAPDVFHDSESHSGNITLSCTWSPAAANTDPRYVIDRVSTQILNDFFDQELPTGGVVAQPADNELLKHIRDHVSLLSVESNEAKEKCLMAETAFNERDNDLQATRRELVERDNDLQATRRELVERTANLVTTKELLIERTETTCRELVERTADLVATRELLIERTATLEQMVEQVESLRKELLAAKTRLAQN
jgi:2-polyprenyl-3-methyl-5-hydroxy-6-metoxy-1,4-benzoquinol methylase